MSPDLPTQLPAHVDNVPLALKGQHVNHKRTTAWISPTPRASNTKIRTLPASQHHDDGAVTLDVIHAPARAKELTHLANPFANWLNVSQQSALHLVKPLGQPDSG